MKCNHENIRVQVNCISDELFKQYPNEKYYRPIQHNTKKKDYDNSFIECMDCKQDVSFNKDIIDKLR